MSLAGSTFKHNGAEAIVDSMAPRAKAVGIDLGTTYTCVGVWRSNDRTVEIIPNEHGNRTTPSVVAFTDIERLIGQSAVNQLLSNPSNTVFDAKRLIGRRFSDETVHTDRRLWPFTIEAGADALIAVRFKGEQKKFTAEDISAMILLRMRDAAESYLGCQIKRAVITVPAYFNDAQRRATRDAGRVAGFDVLQILNEPTASAIAYGVVAKSKGGQNVLVFDLGGGTFDVSVLHVRQRKVSVKAVGGDTHLGGEDFNNRLVAHLVQEFQRKHAECNVWGEQRALRRLHCASERAKRELSFSSETVIEVPCLHGGHDLHATLSRAMFERLNQDLFDRCLRVVSECLADAAMTKTDIDKVILVGGSTRIPKIQAMLSYHFGGSQKLCKGLHPDEAVAFGAAVQAAMLNRERNAMEVVLRDVTPLSLGISTRGGLMSVIIPRNTPVPFRKECRYTTSHDNQNRMRFSVFEGERPDVKHNNFIGYVDLQDLPPAPRGALLAVITMEVDSSGILTVKAEHRTLGLREEARFCTSASSFAPEDPFVGDLIAEAESLRADDRVWKKKLLLRNELESLIYDMRKKADQERLLGLIEVADLARIQAVLDAAGEWVSAKSQATQAELELKIKEVKAVCQGLHYRKEAKREVSGASVSVTCLPGFRLRRSRNKLQ